jgi:phosphoglycolate phosphatase
LKLIVFDCDGTLVDSQHMIVAAMGRAYAEIGMPAPPRTRLLSIVGLSLHEAFLELCGGDPQFPVADMVDRYKAAFFALRQTDEHLEPLYPGAREAVTALAARGDVMLGMATGKSRRGVAAVLGRHGLLDHFATIHTSDTAPSKPHPEMVLAAMRETGAEPDDTIVIGDTAFDMTMARAAGARGIAVGWGYHPRTSLVEAGAHAVIDDFSQLLPALEAMWAARPLAASGAR